VKHAGGPGRGARPPGGRAALPSLANAEAAKDRAEHVLGVDRPNDAAKRLGGATQVFGTQLDLADWRVEEGLQRRTALFQVQAMARLGQDWRLVIAHARPCKQGDALREPLKPVSPQR
jgi:hypothetical protein